MAHQHGFIGHNGANSSDETPNVYIVCLNWELELIKARPRQV